MARQPTSHTLHLAPPPRARGQRPAADQVVDVTLRTSERLLLTVEEAAERLGVGRSKMFELIATGEVATIQVGRLRRVEPQALTDFIARHRQSTRA